MKWFHFFTALMLTIGVILLFEFPAILISKPVPPIGQFFSPFSGFWQNATPHTTNYQKELISTGQLSAPVTVQTDTLGIPHLFAQNLEDAVFVQGYLTARDRLWQMDMATRATSGRLAEILGPSLINYDTKQRRLGLHRAAQESIANWMAHPPIFEPIQAYANGINAYIDQLNPNDYPIEFKLLDYQPERCSPYKIALHFKSMAKTLNFGFDDIEMTNLRKAMGQRDFDLLFPEYNPKQTPIIKDYGQWDSIQIQQSDPQSEPDSMAYSKATPFAKPNPGIGSNNWAVSGKKTKSGHPILCNDPHLSLSLPSIWYMLQIHTPEFNTYGVSLAGIPGVIIGFNEHIAWGVTNVGHDVADWYQLKWTNNQRTRYWMDGEETEVKIVYDTIQVKGKKPTIVETKITYWGPVVYEEPHKPYSGMALKWLSLEASPSNEMATFFHLAKAKNYEDYVASAKSFGHPAQNMVFASREGDIAMRVQGYFPLKKQGQGRFIQDGSRRANDWLGIIPQDNIPQTKNPSEGFVSSANQHSTSPSYPYYYNGGFSDYRGRIIANKLSQMQDITIPQMMALQNNTFSLKAKEALPTLLASLDSTRLAPKHYDIMKELSDWDYHYRKDAIEPVLFTVWFEKFKERTWDEIMQLPDSIPFMYPDDWRTIALMEEDSLHQFFDLALTSEIETLSDIATISFGDMVETLAEQLNDSLFNWQAYMKPSVIHLANIDAFSRKDLDIGGDKNVINAMNGDFGPSWRMIVELSNPIKAYGVIPGGTSGNPGSPFYDNMIPSWSAGRYYELIFMEHPDLTDKNTFPKTELFE